MGATISIFGDWSHVIAAALFAALAIWIGRRMNRLAQGKALVAALSLTAIWSLSIAFVGVDDLETGLVESLRNCAWLTVLLTCLRENIPGEERRRTGLVLIYLVLLATLVMQTLVDMMWPIAGHMARSAVIEGGLLLRIIWIIGALLMIQHIIMLSPPDARGRMAPVLGALGAMWFYDLILYTCGYFGAGWTASIFAMRGVMMAALVPLLALTARTPASSAIQPSRQLAVRGVGTAAVLALALVLVSAVSMVEQMHSTTLRLTATGAIFACIVGALIVMPSARFRSLLRVMVAKHLFQHRYDYRAQWMAFADTIGRTDASAAPIYERAIKAVADITESPGGVLLLRDDDGGMTVHSAWNWPDTPPLGESLHATLVRAMAENGWVIDVDEVRVDRLSGHALPNWLATDRWAWALVPILHFDQLSGALLLARPVVSRRLDWEDYDMLRTAGRQVASYIAEAGGQQALAEARRFDEFNRRFAFIMHDIKNLVSQLSLLARNARRHADNPDFRTDMILTLEESVGKMNDMLARLSQHNSGGTRDPVDFTLSEIAKTTQRLKGSAHPLLIDGDMGLRAHADPSRVEQIVLHLVQNAMDASPPDSPIRLHLHASGEYACLSVIDRGCGMTPDFVRNDLFRPFASSKPGGFGIGAFEARELARAMGGRLEVETHPDKGSRFNLCLPIANACASHNTKSTEEAA